LDLDELGGSDRCDLGLEVRFEGFEFEVFDGGEDLADEFEAGVVDFDGLGLESREEDEEYRGHDDSSEEEQTGGVDGRTKKADEEEEDDGDLIIKIGK
jgi:hypothetical protein